MIHFVGIGGIGMSAIATVLHEQGSPVSGCDRAESAMLDRLRTLGIACSAPHAAAHLAGVGGLVVSTAIDPSTPELVAAREAGIPIRHRAEALADLIRPHRRRVVVTGAHGKTTTSAMIAYALRALGRDPTFLVGGDVRALGTNAAAGNGEICVAEGDESDRSVALLPVDVAVVLNVDLDHLDHYRSVEELVDLLAGWVAAIPAAGLVVLGDGVAIDADARIERFGVGPGEGLRALDPTVGADGVTFRPSRGPERVRLRVTGLHNAGNACAAALALEACGVPLVDAFAALTAFDGACRRFEHVGDRGGARIVDDYAHHPVELAASIAAARASSPGRLVVYFQPHMPWRTRAFGPAFAAALAGADVVVLSETYVARGTPDADASARRIAEELERLRPGLAVTWAPSYDDAAGALAALVRDGDLVLCCGAGPVDQVARALVRK